MRVYIMGLKIPITKLENANEAIQNLYKTHKKHFWLFNFTYNLPVVSDKIEDLQISQSLFGNIFNEDIEIIWRRTTNYYSLRVTTEVLKLRDQIFKDIKNYASDIQRKSIEYQVKEVLYIRLWGDEWEFTEGKWSCKDSILNNYLAYPESFKYKFPWIKFAKYRKDLITVAVRKLDLLLVEQSFDLDVREQL